VLLFGLELQSSCQLNQYYHKNKTKLGHKNWKKKSAVELNTQPVNGICGAFKSWIWCQTWYVLLHICKQCWFDKLHLCNIYIIIHYFTKLKIFAWRENFANKLTNPLWLGKTNIKWLYITIYFVVFSSTQQLTKNTHNTLCD
jgi:hypothetical protein